VTVELDAQYNEGPITLDMEVDELHDGAPGLLLYIHSKSKGHAEGTTINLGIGAVEITPGSETEMRYHMCARLEPARQLRDKLTELVSDMESIIVEGWATP